MIIACGTWRGGFDPGLELTATNPPASTCPSTYAVAFAQPERLRTALGTAT
jgi:hypothetical protein